MPSRTQPGRKMNSSSAGRDVGTCQLVQPPAGQARSAATTRSRLFSYDAMRHERGVPARMARCSASPASSASRRSSPAGPGASATNPGRTPAGSWWYSLRNSTTSRRCASKSCSAVTETSQVSKSHRLVTHTHSVANAGSRHLGRMRLRRAPGCRSDATLPMSLREHGRRVSSP